MTVWITPSSVRTRYAPPPSIGRHRELSALRNHLELLLAGLGGLILIGGEEGIGKSTLATVACREAADTGALVLAGHCYDRTAQTPYSLWRDLAERYPAGGDLPPLPAMPANCDPAQPDCREACYTTICTFLTTLARRHPLVLLLEDLHWADSASLDLLRTAARHLGTMPLLLICTYRQEIMARDHPLHVRMPALVRETDATRLDLTALTETDLVEVVEDRYSLAAVDAHSLASFLHKRADGNPLFVAELLRLAEEEGYLRSSPEGWWLSGLPQNDVPPLLRQVLDDRLRHLSPEDRHLLELASAIGQEVPVDLWSAVAGVTEATLVDTIERGEALHLLACTRDGTQVRFVHALLHDACYEGASPTRRRGWHRQIAEAMIALRHCDPDAVAAHFRQAGDGRAAEWLVRAGDDAYHARAYRTALERYEAAAKVPGENVPTGEQAWLRYRLAHASRFLDPARERAELSEAGRLAATMGDRPLAALARYHLGQSRFLAGEYEAGQAQVAAAVEALEALTPEERDSLAARNGLAGLADVSDTVGTLLAVQATVGQFSAVATAADRWGITPGLPVPGDQRGDARGVAGFVGLGQWHAALGRPGKARTFLAQARDHYATLGESFQFGLVAAFELTHVLLPFHADQQQLRRQLGTELERVWRLADECEHIPSPAVFRAPFMAAAGDWAGAMALAHAALADVHLSVAHQPARCLLGQLARNRGATDRAWQYIRDALPAGPDTAPGTAPICVAMDQFHLAASLALDAGDPQAARPWLDAAARWLDWSGVVRWQAEQQLLWGRYHQAAGDLSRAYHAAFEAIGRASEPRQPLALLAAHRFLGELATALGRTRDAATHLAAAHPLAEACALPYERALTLLALAELWVAEGRRDAVTPALAEARRLAVALGAAPVVVRADTLAAHMATPGAMPHPAGLSVREMEVLRLLARGATNRAIAEELYLSERTVQVHVRHILSKTDTANRVAATAFALRHDLA